MDQLIRVLYIDDSDADRDLVCDALEMEHGGFEAFQADSRKALEMLLDEGEYDVVLSDFNILGFEDLDVIDLVRAKKPAVPVIIVTSTGSETIALESMKRGAVGYVVKSPGHIRHLPLTIQSVLEKVALLAECKALRAKERLSNAVFSSATEGIMVTDADKNILSVNRAFTKITGYTADEVIGKNPRIFKSGVHDSSFYKDMMDAVSAHGHWEGEIWDRRKDGVIYPKWMSITAIKEDEGQRKVVQYLALFSDITDRKEDEKELHVRAYYDPLTRLPNRIFAFERLSQTIKQDIRYERRGALFFVDLDHFKQINDTLGHISGDQVLREAADRLHAAIRETDTVARTGGDEFLIILPEVPDLREVRIVADKILEVLSRPFHVNGRELFLGASIGITMIPEDGDEATTLLKNSDMAMYQAKSSGRNNYQFFNKEMEKTDKARTLLEWDLRQAMDKHELVLHYQPIIELCSLKTVALEALIRWHHPRHGLVFPDRFIPLAEQSALISKISKWVLSTACTQVKQWQHRYGLKIDLAVNLSTRDFRYSHILPSITEILKRSGLAAESLIIEITEGLMLDPNEEALKKLQGLKKSGIRISIDDFGTGYSSLSYLSRYPIDLLKIDKSFIQSIDSDSQKKVLVEAMIKMGQSMGMKIIAEGLESAEELSLLRELGCDKVQGFYFSKALSAEDYEALLEKQQTDCT